MKLLFKTLVCILLFISCIDETNIDEEDLIGAQLKTYSFNSASNSSLMFQDNEELEVMTSEWRIYKIGKVIRIKPIDSTRIEVANFAPMDLKNITITATIKGYEKPINLFKIEEIRAHGKQEINYPFVDDISSFLNINNEAIDLSSLKESGIAPDDIEFDFTGDTKVIQQLKKLQKLKWEIKYHDFDPNNSESNNWEEDISAKDIRRFSGLIINMGIIFCSDDFKNEFINETIIGNDGTTVLTESEKEEVYNQLLNKARFNCGKVVNVSGLGGGSTFGVAEHILRDFLEKNTSFIVAHEVGHMLGYNHSSNMTYPDEINGVNTGIIPAMSRVIERFFDGRLFPVTSTNYYLFSDL